MKKIILILSTLLLAGGFWGAQAYQSRNENVFILSELSEGDVVNLRVKCRKTSGSCFYRCPQCGNLYEAMNGVMGPLISGPASCGCGGTSPINPGVGDVNP